MIDLSFGSFRVEHNEMLGVENNRRGVAGCGVACIDFVGGAERKMADHFRLGSPKIFA